MALAGRLIRCAAKLFIAAVTALLLSLVSLGQALAASPGCAAVNSGQLNYTGPSPTAHLGVILGEFYPGDQLLMTYTTNSPKALVILDLILTSVSVSTVATGTTGTTYTQSATVGALLPIGAKAGITDATALINSRNVVMTVACTPAPAPTTLSLSASPSSTIFGQSTTLTAHLSSVGGQPNGNVIFSIDNVPQAPVAAVNGVARLSTNALSVGSHSVTASYEGNANYTATSANLAGGITVAKASTTTSLSSSTTTASFGSSVSFTANIGTNAPGAGTPGGSVVFTIDNIDQAPVALSNGRATLTTTALGVGLHQISARYTGSPSYNGSNSATTEVSVSKAATTTALTQTTDSTVYGGPITFRATVTSSTGGTPTGAIIFTVDNVPQAPVDLVGGIAELTISNLSAGNHAVSASYAGSSTLLASSGALGGGHTVNAIPTTTTLTSSGAIAFGETATITVQIASGRGTPTGSVVFAVDDVNRPAMALSDGTATMSLAGISAGSHTVTATYAGTATFGASSAALTGGQVVNRAVTETTLNAVSAVAFGQALNIVANVTGGSTSPDGAVTFTVGGVQQNPVAIVDGRASILVPGLAVGAYEISANYSGNANFVGSAASGSATVNKAAAPLSVTSSANPAVAGQGLTFTATATGSAGAPTGVVVFIIDGIEQSPIPLINGVANISRTSLSVDTHAISARYDGSASYLGSTASLAGDQVVGRAATTVAVASTSASGPFGSPVTVSAQVTSVAPGTGTPTGDIIFTIDGVAQPAVSLSSGTVSITRTNLDVGTHTVTARYLGDDNFASSSGALPADISVAQASTSTALASAPTEPRLGDAVTLAATVSGPGTPTGSVIFTSDSVEQEPVALVNGAASLRIPGLGLGDHTFSARFVGSSNYLPSTADEIVVAIAAAQTTTSANVNPASIRLGESVSLSASVSASQGTPSGDIQFYADGILLGTAQLSGSTAGLSTTTLGRGTHTITAQYAGSTDHAASSGTATTSVEVLPGTARLDLRATPQPANYGDSVTVTATVAALSGSPAGSVTFTRDGVALPPVTVENGVASITLAGLEPGSHAISADYSGSDDHLPAPGVLAGGIVIGQATVGVELDTTPSQPVFGEAVIVTAVFTSSLDVPTGDVVFVVDGAAQPPVAIENGTARISLTNLSAGMHAVEARFAGDEQFQAISVQLAGGLNIAPAATEMSLTANPNPVAFGAPVTFEATVSATNLAPTGMVTFTIDGVAQSPVALSGGKASLTTSGLGVGAHSVTANFAAQGNFSESLASLSGDLDVDVATTTTSVAGPTAPLAFGDTARFTAVVGADNGMPTGSVVFNIDGIDQPPVSLTEGEAMIDFVFTGAGYHAVRATYTGAATFAPSTAMLEGGIVIAKAETEASLSVPASAAFGATVTASVNLSSDAGAPSGSVTFFVDGSVAGAGVVTNGSASIVLTGLSAGEHEITARYDGDLDFAASTTSVAKLVVGPATVSLSVTSSDMQIEAGAPITVMVTASAAGIMVSGDVTISIGTTDYSVPLRDGVASLTVSDLDAGTYPIAIFFAGSAEFASASASLDDLAVDPAPTDIEVTADLPRGVAGSSYSGKFTAYGGIEPYVYSVSDGELPPGLELDEDTGVIAGVPTSPGPYSWEITAIGSAGKPGQFAAQITVLAGVTITMPTAVPDAVFGEDYDVSVAASGSTSITYAVIAGNLPPGLTLNASDGTIRGMPSQLGAATFTIVATDADGFAASTTYTLTVGAPNVTVSGNFDDAAVGVDYSAQVTASGGQAPYQYTVEGTLPPGLVFDASGGSINGVPTQVGAASFIIRAADANGFDSAITIVFEISAPPIVILPSTLAVARENRAYAQALTVTGGTGPYSYVVSSGTLPGGVRLESQTGRLVGTPTESGSFAFTAEARDATGVTGLRSYTLEVAAAAVLNVDTALDSIVAGTTYADAITVDGGTVPYRFEIVGGALPAGLSLDPDTGEIDGTTLLPGTYILTIIVTDGEGDNTFATLTLRVVVPVITIAGTVNGANFGSEVEGSLSASGGTEPYNYALTRGALPSGATLNEETGEVSGTATSAGRYSAVITARDANGFTGSIPLEIEILAPTLTLSAIEDEYRLGIPVRETLVASGGVSPYAFTFSGFLPAGLEFDVETGVLSGTPVATGIRGFTITATDANGFAVSRQYMVDIASNTGEAQLAGPPPVATAGTNYSGLVTATGGAAPLRYTITDGVLPDGLSLNPTTGEISGETLVTGSFRFELTVTGADGRINVGNYTLVSVPPTLSATSQPAEGEAGAPYSQTLSVIGGTADYRFALISGTLPEGLTLTSSGEITGTPRLAGIFSILVRVTDANNFAAELTFQLELTPPAIAIIADLRDGRVNRDYDGTITATGGAAPLRYSVTSGQLPDGVYLDADSGLLSGAPNAPGVATFTVTATDANGFSASITRSVTIASNVGTATMPVSLVDGMVGNDYPDSLAASGGTSPYRYAVTAGALPDGLTLDPNSGDITGQPIAPGRSTFTIAVTDSADLVNQQTYELVIAAPPIAIEADPPAAEAGRPYSANVALTGGTAPYQFVLQNAPPGLSIDDTGRISGTPTQPGRYNFTVVVTDALGSRTSEPFTVVVASVPVELGMPPSLPQATENEAYAASVVPNNAVGQVTYTLVNGTELPDGLVLDGTSGIISGVPSAPGSYTYDIRAVDADGNVGEARYVLVIQPNTPDQPVSTTASLTVNKNSVVVGENLTLDVSVSTAGGFANAGLVTIRDAQTDTVLASGAVASDGSARFTLSLETTGGRSLVARYEGTESLAASDSASTGVSVLPATTAITLSGNFAAATAENTILAVAKAERVAPANGSAGPGLIVFTLDGVDYATEMAVSGSASIGLHLPAGAYRIGARFEPAGSDDIGSSQEEAFAVTSATTTQLVVPTEDVEAGASVTYVATVLPTALGAPLTGNVVFRDNGVVVATVELVDGAASYATTISVLGAHEITAAFSGDEYYGASTSATMRYTVLDVNDDTLVPSETVLTSSTLNPRLGETVDLVATVTAEGVVPTGNVQFQDATSGAVLDIVLLDGAGTATLNLTPSELGNIEINALYSGDARVLESRDDLTLSVAAAGTQITLTPSTSSVLSGESVTLSAKVARPDGSPTGAGIVAFVANGNAFAEVETDGASIAEATSNPLNTPTQFVAEFRPHPSSVDTPAVSNPVTVQTLLTVPLVTVTAAIGSDGSASGTVTVTPPAGISQTPTGQVTLAVDGISDQVLTLADSTTEFDYPPGTFPSPVATFTAEYPGDTNFAAATGSTTTAPGAAVPTQTLLTLSETVVPVGTSVAATIRVTSATNPVLGQVAVFIDGREIAKPTLVDGVATVALNDLAVGEAMISARYLGMAAHAPSLAEPVTVTVTALDLGKIALSLSADSEAIFSAGQRISVFAEISALEGDITGIALSSAIGFTCPRTSLAEGATMRCIAQYTVTAADMAMGQATLSATATATNAESASAELTLTSASDLVSDTFTSLSQSFVVDRARVLGAALPLQDILTRRRGGTRAGTVQASNTDTGQILAFTTSLAEWRNWGAAQAADGMAIGDLDQPLPINIWIDAQLSIHASSNGDEAWGRLGTVALGADYLITEDFFAGVMVQGDWATQTSTAGDVSGSGFLIGPYASLALGNSLSFDATVLYGRSINTASATVLGEAFTGDFETSRLYAKAALTGYFEIDQLTLRPNATFLLSSESTGDYHVSSGSGAVVDVPGGDHLQYQLTVGGTAEYAIALENGAMLTPMIGLDIGFNGVLTDGLVQEGSMLGRLSTGIQFQTGNGMQLGVEFRTELDDNGFSSAGARATVRGQF